jgi:glycosyltransferase involved in cell wall biosynthesis
MHIVIDARIIHSSTGRYIERLLHYLQEIDTANDYTILVPSKDINYWKPTAKNFSVLPADFANYSFSEQIGFKKLLDSLKPDLVHFCMPQQPILFQGTRVTTFHDLNLLNTYNSDKNWLVFRFKQLIGRFVFQSAARQSVHLLTPTEYTRQDVAKTLGVSPSKMTVTYEAADTIIGEAQPYDLPFTDFILYVGQQSDYKNIKRLGDAHQALLKTHPGLGLVLVGSKNASAVKNESYFKNKQYTNILFTGFVDDAQLAWLYQHCQAYVFPSLMEGFGLPGLEAMSYGAPVASSNATCLPEVYGGAAHYFNPRDTANMTNAIEAILNNQTYRHELITKGYEQVQQYSWKRMALQTHAVYMNAVKK